MTLGQFFVELDYSKIFLFSNYAETIQSNDYALQYLPATDSLHQTLSGDDVRHFVSDFYWCVDGAGKSVGFKIYGG